MTDLYVTIKLNGGTQKATDREYVDFANLLLTKLAIDSDFRTMLTRGGSTDTLHASVQVRGFDPIVLGGCVIPECTSKPIDPIRPQDTILFLTRQMAELT